MDLAAVESERVLQQRLHSQSVARKAAEARMVRIRREADMTHEQLDALRAELDERRALDKATEARHAEEQARLERAVSELRHQLRASEASRVEQADAERQLKLKAAHMADAAARELNEHVALADAAQTSGAAALQQSMALLEKQTAAEARDAKEEL